jgi:hypothetical protein
MGYLSELVAQFQSAARFYFDRAFRNGRDLPDLQNDADTFAAMNRLVEVGKALAAELERASEDSTELHRLLDAAFMGLEKDRYTAVWEPLRVSLARIATVVALTPPPGSGLPVQQKGDIMVSSRRDGVLQLSQLADWCEVQQRELIPLLKTDGFISDARERKTRAVYDELCERLTNAKWHSILRKLTPSRFYTAKNAIATLGEVESGCREVLRRLNEKQGEGIHGAGATLKQPAIASGTTREAVLRQLEPAVRKAYLAFQYAETLIGRRMEDREAYDWLRENGIDQGKGDLGELTDYELPDSLETFRRYLGTARKSLGEGKYTKRGGRTHGRSIVRGNEIEYQKGDGA